ncbi:MAG: hypothetical protein IT339_05060 [Thermomicrobiales bacterium]|nr:hypothetical protein [Thermomicrobiales bacterium]
MTHLYLGSSGRPRYGGFRDGDEIRSAHDGDNAFSSNSYPNLEEVS